MGQKSGDFIVVCIVAGMGLTVGNVIGGLFAGIPLMIIAGILAHLHVDKLTQE